jgi:hypothetical protein
LVQGQAGRKFSAQVDTDVNIIMNCFGKEKKSPLLSGWAVQDLKLPLFSGWIIY